MPHLHAAAPVAVSLVLAGCSSPTAPAAATVEAAGSPAETIPVSAAADVTRVKLTTTKGDVVIEVHPEWAPRGAERFLTLVREGFYDGVKFFRVLDGFMAQTGIAGDPAIHAAWKDKTIKDDPVVKSNQRGFVTFAKTGAPDSRSTQFFINFADNANLDSMAFAPFGEVVEGMDVIDSLYSGYGEGAPRGRGPDQSAIVREGNAYLEDQFPKLDAITKAEVVEAE